MTPGPAPVRSMTAIRYYRDGRPWDAERVPSPSWSVIEAAIRRMDNYCFPIVQLNTTNDDEDADIFNVLGGAGRWAIFQLMGEWQYEDTAGGEADGDGA